jgi:hypothetical protein
MLCQWALSWQESDNRLESSFPDQIRQVPSGHPAGRKLCQLTLDKIVVSFVSGHLVGKKVTTDWKQAFQSKSDRQPVNTQPGR